MKTSRIAEENPAPIMRLHRGDTVGYANPAAQRLLSAGHLKWDQPSGQALIKTARLALDCGRTEALEILLGDRRFSINFAPVQQADYVNLYFSDITQRWEAELALRESEGRFRATAESAPLMIWMSGTDKACTYVNRTWHEFTGRTMEQELGDGWCQSVHPADLRRCLQVYATAFDARQEFKMEYRVRRHDGQYRWLLDCGKPRFAAADDPAPNADSPGGAPSSSPEPTLTAPGTGEFLGYIGSCVDITDRKENELILRHSNEQLERAVEKRTAELRRNNEALEKEIEEHKRHKETLRRLAVIVESSTEAIFSVGLNQTILSWNRGAERLFGFASRKILGMPLSTLVSEDRPGLFQQLHARCARGERVATVDTLVLTGSGGHRPMAITASTVKDSSGLLQGVSFIARDISERKQAETATRASEAKFRAFVELGPDAVVIVNTSGRVHLVNAQAERLFGYSREELTGKPIERLMPARMRRDHPFSRLESLAKPGLCPSGSGFEIVGRRKNGAEFPIEVNLSPLRTATGTLVCADIRDITERKRADEDLRRMLALMNDLYHNAPCAYHSVDRTGRFVEVNDTALKWLGYTREELIRKKTIFDLETPESRKIGRAAFRRIKNGEPIRDLELEFVRKDGSTMPVLLNATPITAPGGRFIQSRTTFIDLTARRKAERALAESEARLHAILDYSPAVIFLKDPKGRYLLVNRTFERAFGITSDRVLGRRDDEVFPPQQAKAFSQNDRRVLKSGAPRAFEETATYVNGTRTSMVVKFPLGDRAGTAYAIGGIAVDITARKEAEQQLHRNQEHYLQLFHQARRAQDDLRELSRAMVRALEEDRRRISRELHDDVGQALTGVSMALVALRNRLGESPITAAFENVQESLRQAMRTVHTVALNLRPSVLDELGLIPALRSHLKNFAERTGLQVRLRSDPVVESLTKDKKIVLFRVAQESLSNVAKHAHASRVTVTLRKTDSSVILLVADNGTSFVDDPGRPRRTRRLGLLGMRERARLINGKFRLLRRPGKGTTVRLEVAATPAPIELSPPPNGSLASGGPQPETTPASDQTCTNGEMI